MIHDNNETDGILATIAALIVAASFTFGWWSHHWWGSSPRPLVAESCFYVACYSTDGGVGPPVQRVCVGVQP